MAGEFDTRSRSRKLVVQMVGEQGDSEGGEHG